ncbi:MAG: DUF805 domain-containing protein [Pseudomonadota bacterium]
MRWLFDFRGSIGRLEWLALQIISIALYITMSLLLMSQLPMELETLTPEALESSLSGSSFVWALTPIWLVATWIGTVSMIKRFHDRGRSGFWLLTPLAPALIGFELLSFLIMLLIYIGCAFFPGKDDGNPYASAPKSMSKADLIQSVKDGDGVRPEVRALNATAKSKPTRQEVQINRSDGTGFGRRLNTPYS